MITDQDRRVSLRLLQSCFRTMLKKQVLAAASCEYETTETEGLVFVIHVEDATTSEDHRVPFHVANDYNDAIKVMSDIGKRFSERNPPVALPPPTPEELDKMYGKFKEALGEMVPEYQKERLKWD
ncbi:hypothetical protein N9917_00230 [Deltaproteobacteria bacterium]|nr:hypothetical protein [Deltaproteobacteria bacterium]